MANKLTKEKIDLLIEQVLSEDFETTFPKRKRPKDDGQGDGGVTNFINNFKLSHTEKNRRLIASMYAHDGDPTTLSKQDLENVINNPKYDDITKSIARVLYNTESIEQNIIDFFDQKFGSLRLGYDGNDINVEPYFVFPEWIKFASRGQKDTIKRAALETEPELVFTNSDVIDVVEDSSSPLHYWMLEFLDNSIVFAQQGRFEDSINKFILANFKPLLDKSKRIDTGDKALGRGKALPNIPVTGRYASKTGGETPETLQRIFQSANLMEGSSLQQKLKGINSFLAKVKKKDLAGLSIEQISNNMIVVDYLKRIVQDYEASAGGFLFENFLALLLSGTKEGGNLKIEDFTYSQAGRNNDILGSAKLYRVGASTFSGSKALFYQAGLRQTLGTAKGVLIKYILAKKGENLEKVYIYEYDIYAKKIDGTDKVGLYDKINNLLTEIGPKEKGQIEFAWPEGAPIAFINFQAMKIKDSEYQGIVKEAMNSTKEKLGDLNISINNLSTSVTKYFSILNEPENQQEKLDSWKQTLEDIKSFRRAAYKTFSEVDVTKTELTGVQDVAAATIQDLDDGGISETKSKKDLDKLIERVILESMNKK